MELFKPHKLVIAYLLLALVSAQFLLAQHSIVHLDSNYQTQQDNDDNDSDICQICVTAKNRGQDFLVQTYLALLAPSADEIFSGSLGHAAHSTCYKPFQSQGPPKLFS